MHDHEIEMAWLVAERDQLRSQRDALLAAAERLLIATEAEDVPKTEVESIAEGLIDAIRNCKETNQ